MRKQPLIETNPYLKDPAMREKLLKRSVASSTAIEGVHAAVKKALGLEKKGPSATASPLSKSSAKPKH